MYYLTIVKFAFTWEEKGNSHLEKVIKLKLIFFSLANTVPLGHKSVSSRFLMELHLTLGADLCEKAFPYISVDYLD